MTNTELRRLRRNTLHMTQRALADALGVQGMTVSRWETGWNPIPPLAATAITLLAEKHSAVASRSTSGRRTPSRRQRA
jgi:DNA-binding transcriptional regulator YiaG